MCPTPDSTLADPQEINADLQRQLAECRAERDEALARETAMAEVLQVINSSPGELAPVFDSILEKAHSLCGAVKGAMVTYDGEHFRGRRQRPYDQQVANRVRSKMENSVTSQWQYQVRFDVNDSATAESVRRKLRDPTLAPAGRPPYLHRRRGKHRADAGGVR